VAVPACQSGRSKQRPAILLLGAPYFLTRSARVRWHEGKRLRWLELAGGVSGEDVAARDGELLDRAASLKSRSASGTQKALGLVAESKNITLFL
jgi:hypothetical protein